MIHSLNRKRILTPSVIAANVPSFTPGQPELERVLVFYIHTPHRGMIANQLFSETSKPDQPRDLIGYWM
jgi:hypothetical protein